MKKSLSYILFLLLSLTSLTSWANSEDDLLDFLDRSAEEIRIQVLKNEELVSQGRASEGVYFYDLRYQYNNVETVTRDRAVQLNQTFSFYNNHAFFILMPLYAQGPDGKTAAMAAMQTYVRRVANRLDPNGTHTVIGICTVLGFTQDKYSFPVQVDGVNTDQTISNNTKSVLQNITCKREDCYVNAFTSFFAGMNSGEVKGDVNTIVNDLEAESTFECDSRKVLLLSNQVAEFKELDYSRIGGKFYVNKSNHLYEFVMDGKRYKTLYSIDINSSWRISGHSPSNYFVDWESIDLIAVEEKIFTGALDKVYYVNFRNQNDSIERVYYNIRSSPYCVILTKSFLCVGEVIIGRKENELTCYTITAKDCSPGGDPCFPLHPNDINVEHLVEFNYANQSYDCLAGITREKRIELLQTMLSSGSVTEGNGYEPLVYSLILSTPDADAKYILDEFKKRNLIDPLLNNTQFATFDDIALKLIGWIQKYYPMPSGDQVALKVLNQEMHTIDFMDNKVSGSVSGNVINLERDAYGLCKECLDPTLKADIDVDVYGYVLIYFNDDVGQFKKGQKVPMPALLALYLFNKDRREFLIASTKLTADIILIGLGVGEIQAAYEAYLLYRGVRTAYTCYIGIKAVSDFGMGIADITIQNTLAEEWRQTPEGLERLDRWNKINAMYAVGSLSLTGIEGALTKLGFIKGVEIKDVSTFERVCDKLEDAGGGADALFNLVYKNVKYEDFITTFSATETQYKVTYQLWGENKWDELYQYFKSNNLNGGWPPFNGVVSINKIEIGGQLNGKVFDRFQIHEELNGSFASPVLSGSEGVNDLIFTYDSRALKDNIRDGTYYIKFSLKNDLPNNLIFEYGEAIPWFNLPGYADQIKSNINFNLLKDEIEIIEILKYTEGVWKKIK